MTGNRAQDFLAAAAEEIEVDREFAVDLRDERQSLTEPIVGALDFELHQGAEGGGVLVAGNVGLADGEATQVFERKIDASLGVVGADVLPEVGEL